MKITKKIRTWKAKESVGHATLADADTQRVIGNVAGLVESMFKRAGHDVITVTIDLNVDVLLAIKPPVTPDEPKKAGNK